MHRRILAAVVAGSILLLAAGRSHAQFFGSSFSTSTYVERIVGDSVRSQKPDVPPPPTTGEAAEGTEGLLAPQAFQGVGAASAPGPTPPSGSTQPEKKKFWKDRIYSLAYDYSHRDYSGDYPVPLPDLEADVNTVSPEVHLSSPKGFKLDLAALYVRSDSIDRNSVVVDSNNYAVLVTPSIALFGRNVDPCDVANLPTTQLTLGMGMGYRHTDLETVVPGARVDSGFEALTLIPSLVLTHVFVPEQSDPGKVSLPTTLVSAIAAYGYDTSTSSSETAFENDGTEGILTMGARGDFYVPNTPIPCLPDQTRAHLSATALWKHYAQASVRSIPGDDSAEFAVSLGVPLPLPTREYAWRIRFSYAYEAFREDYQAHRGQLYLEGPMWR